VNAAVERLVGPDDIAGVVDPERVGGCCAGVAERGEGATRVHEPVRIAI
jgi:hypothetical protein